MDSVTSRAIDLVEAAYDLRSSDDVWLQQLLVVGKPILDHGLGLAGVDFQRPPTGAGGGVIIQRVITHGLPSDYEDRFRRAMSTISPEVAIAMMPAGWAGTWTELSADHSEVSRTVLEVMGYADVLGILATDPNGFGIHIAAPLREPRRLTPRRRERWKMLAAHITSAHRLRRALTNRPADETARPKTRLPLDAEAVFAVPGFRMVDSAGPEAHCAAEVLRDAARGVDRARGEMRTREPERAFETWTSLVSGRWSMVD